MTNSDDFYLELKKLIPGLTDQAKKINIRLENDKLATIEVEQYIDSKRLETEHKKYRLIEETLVN